MTTKNLRARIEAGEEVVALRSNIEWSKEELTAIWADANCDFIWLDSQHSAYSDHLLIAFTAAAEELGIPVQLRIPHTRDAHKVGRFFDLGPTGCLVPEVMEEYSVVDAIDYAYYGPTGRRSWGGANRRGIRSKEAPSARLDYAAWWNSSVLLSFQIESVEAVTNLRRLIRPGITHVTFGPNDLSFSIEAHPDYPLRTVEECMANVRDQLAGTNIRIAMGTGTHPDERQMYRDLGVTIFQA
jgi:2-keto-3-deoxy-L-rhamnonate aldolase RhmA